MLRPDGETESATAAATTARADLLVLSDRRHEEEERRRHRRHRETVVIPRLRLLGSLWLLGGIVLHNWLLLGSFHLRLVVAFAALQVVYLVASKVVLSRYYRQDARFDLGTFFLVADIAVFVAAIYVSGGERSWLLPLLCVRVADQVGTSQRRAFAFACVTAVLHAGLVLYMAFVEQRGFALSGELAKVLLVYLLNVYLALAAAPGERQRKRATRLSEVARSLIEELKQKTEQLEVERARAETANQAKSAFLANMSHEIRTPMTAVLGMAELLLAEPLRPSEREMVETILRAGRSLLSLVNDVLDMSKIEAGELEIDLDQLELRELIEGVLSPMQVLARGKGIALELEADELWGRPLVGDALRLKQVLLNLVGNALKFTPAGRVLLRIELVEAIEQGLRLRFAVEDTGIGMTEEQLGRVFEPFQQADLSTTRRFAGTGLGLSIARHLVSRMGGDLRASSVPGGGSVFEFELFFAFSSAVEETASSPEEVDAIDLLRARGARVLVAEDTDVNRLLLTRMLEHLGCAVESVHDGAQAVERVVGEGGYDAVFLDWHMPVMDGLEAVRRIRRWEAERKATPTPVVGVTASVFEEEVARCRRAGMDIVLSKPLVRADLEQALCRCVLGTGPRPRISQRPPPPADPDPRLDTAQLEDLSRLDPDPDAFLRSIVVEFLDNARGRMSGLERAMLAGDFDRARNEAHALKGSAASVGAVRLAARFGAVESGARANDAVGAEGLLCEMRQEFGETEAILLQVVRGANRPA